MAVMRRQAAAGIAGQAALLWSMPAVRQVSAVSRTVTALSVAAMDVAVAVGLRRTRTARLGPADAVTLARGTLACAIAGLAVDDVRCRRRSRRDGHRRPARGWHRTAGARVSPPAASGALVSCAAVALALDGLDGQVARRTHTTSAFGATLDGETDALLILVLSLHDARLHGAWVAAGGIARYAFAAAGRIWPWMRRPLPFRYWRKVATAGEGVALAAGAASFVPRPIARAALAVGLAMIAESFGRDILWLHRRRREP